MNVLLDTHIILWWLNDDLNLIDTHREIISDINNLCYISAATIWEISIKSKLGKLKIDANYIDEIRKDGFLELPINWIYSNHVKKLPLLHTDPFDRLLIAQAQMENLTLLTVDNNIKKYKIKVS